MQTLRLLNKDVVKIWNCNATILFCNNLDVVVCVTKIFHLFFYAVISLKFQIFGLFVLNCRLNFFTSDLYKNLLSVCLQQLFSAPRRPTLASAVPR